MTTMHRRCSVHMKPINDPTEKELNMKTQLALIASLLMTVALGSVAYAAPVAPKHVVKHHVKHVAKHHTCRHHTAHRKVHHKA